MRADLAPRILALPADIRATLARVEGPGWYVARRIGASRLWDFAPYVRPEPLGERLFPCDEAWWPANPAQAVAAVLGCSIRQAHRELHFVLTDDGDDHAAAVAIIEAHVASRSKE